MTVYVVCSGLAKGELFLKRVIRDSLQEIDSEFNPSEAKLTFLEHHLLHLYDQKCIFQNALR